jgi:hypothetical protein
VLQIIHDLVPGRVPILVAGERKVREATKRSWGEERQAVVPFTPRIPDSVARFQNDVVQSLRLGVTAGGEPCLTSPDNDNFVIVNH